MRSTIDTVTGEVSVASGQSPVGPVLAFENSSGSVISWVAGQTVAAIAGSWTPLVPLVAVVPAGAARAVPIFFGDGPPGSVRSQMVTVSQHVVRAPTVDGPLRVVGNQILDANDAPVELRGVDVIDLLDPDTIDELTQQTIEQIWAWGATLVRLSVGEQLLMPGACQYDPSYAADLAQAVDWITSLGMVALVDLHESEPVGCFGAGDQEMADSPGSIDFWSTVAKMFAGNPLVAFDLYNEPHGISQSVWLDGGTAVDYLDYQAAGMQQLYDAVRSTGAQNLVFVSGNDWASEPPTTLLQGYNIVYSLHDYTCPDAGPPSCSNPAPYNPAPIIDRWVGLSKSVPVFVGEFGWPSSTDGSYDAAVIALAQAHGWGWDAFSWSNGGFGLLASAAQSTLGGEPDPSAMPVLAALARQSG